MTLQICAKKDASNRTFSLVKNYEGPQLNWIERGATDSEVEGSSPSGPAKKEDMSKRYSGKSFKDSSTMKKPKLSFKEKRKLKREKAKKK